MRSSVFYSEFIILACILIYSNYSTKAGPAILLKKNADYIDKNRGKFNCINLRAREKN